jgi:hypothetical protein
MKMVALEAGQAAGGSPLPVSGNVTRSRCRGGAYFGSWRVLFCVGEFDSYPSIGVAAALSTTMFCVPVLDRP